MRILKILGNRALVEFDDGPENNSPIFIPEVFRKKKAVGTIVMMGTGKKVESFGLKPGDRVLTDINYGSFECVHEGKTCRIHSVLDLIVQSDDIRMEDPKEILRSPLDLRDPKGFANPKTI